MRQITIVAKKIVTEGVVYTVDKNFLMKLLDTRMHARNLGSKRTFFRDKSGYVVYREKIKLNDDVILTPWLDGLNEIS